MPQKKSPPARTAPEEVKEQSDKWRKSFGYRAMKWISGKGEKKDIELPMESKRDPRLGPRKPTKY